MKVILNTDVSNLGEEGDVCEVKPGYVRNYLLPRDLVLLDNRSNRAYIELRRKEIEERKQKKLLEARSTRERIEAESLVFNLPAGENGKLFGSLSSAGISQRLEQMGIEVQRRQIEIPEKTIKSVGTYKVKVRLYGEEEAYVTVVVEPTEASAQKTQRASSEARASASGGAGDTGAETKAPDSTETASAESASARETEPSEGEEENTPSQS